MTPTDTRCPDCGSLVRPGMSWCTLCHADLRSEEEKEAARLESSLLLVPSGATVTAGDDGIADDFATPTARSLAGSVPGAGNALPSRGRHARPSATPAMELPPALIGTPGTPETATAPEGASAQLSAEAVAAAAAAESEAKLAELRQAGIDVDGMLQMLAADKGSDPLTGFVTERLGSKGSRAVAILIASVALTSIGILVMFVLGSVFG